MGLAPLRLRTQPDGRQTRVDEALLQGLDFIRVLLALEPRREAPVHPPRTPHVVVASDAQADSWPSGGFLLFDPFTKVKYGEFFTFTQDFLTLVGFPPEKMVEGEPYCAM